MAHEDGKDEKKYMDSSGNSDLRTRKQLRAVDILHAIRKHIVLIAVMSVAGLVFGIILSVTAYMRGEMSKQYAITTSIAVTSQTKDGLFTAQTNNPNSTDIYLAENMVDSVIYVLKSD